MNDVIVSELEPLNPIIVIEPPHGTPGKESNYSNNYFNLQFICIFSSEAALVAI